MRRVFLLTAMMGTGLAQMHTMHMDPLEKLSSISGIGFESAFLNQMIGHHKMGIEMAKLALEKSKDPRIINNAKNVISQQSKEIKTMEKIIKSLKLNQTDLIHLPMAIPKNGVNIDKWYLVNMIPHHQGAVDMSKLVYSKTKNTDINNLAKSIINNQSLEIKQYHKWLASIK